MATVNILLMANIAQIKESLVVNLQTIANTYNPAALASSYSPKQY